MPRKKTWDQLTPAQRRVEIAKDVRASLWAKKYAKGIIGGGNYIDGPVPPGFEDSRASLTKKDCDFIKQNCTMCARGALLISRVDRFNSLEFNEIGLDYKEAEYDEDGEGRFFFNAQGSDTSAGLHDAFTEEQLGAIEDAFEGWATDEEHVYNNDRNLLPKDRGYRNSGRAFRRAHGGARNKESVLLAICQSIIDNDGDFNIKDRYKIVEVDA